MLRMGFCLKPKFKYFLFPSFSLKQQEAKKSEKKRIFCELGKDQWTNSIKCEIVICDKDI
jgi:hypothetical protein